ncbi:MAG: hypothetical protein ACAI25_11730 [Planctomycetota bacterium]
MNARRNSEIFALLLVPACSLLGALAVAFFLATVGPADASPRGSGASNLRETASCPEPRPAAAVPETTAAVTPAESRGATASPTDLVFVSSSTPGARARRSTTRGATLVIAPGRWLLSNDPGFALRC